MVCPMRIFVGLFSVVLVVCVLAYTLLGHEEPEFLRAPRGAKRSWLRFASTFFTGELLWAWYRGGAPPDAAATPPSDASTAVLSAASACGDGDGDDGAACAPDGERDAPFNGARTKAD